MDLQLTCAMDQDCEPLPPGVSVLDYLRDIDRPQALFKTAAKTADEKLLHSKLHKEKAELWKVRRYLNKDEYCERVCDYVVAYACKGEVSSTEAAEMFAQIIRSDKLDGTTPLASLLHKLNSKLVASKDMPRAEVVFALAGLPCYRGSKRTAHVSLNTGERTVVDGSEDASAHTAATGAPDDDEPALRENAYDKFLRAKETGSVLPATSFYKYASSSGKIPVFSHGRLRPVWPLNEDYSYFMLLLHKCGVMRHSDIKGGHGSYKEAFEHFLHGPDVPIGVVQSLQRAHKASLLDNDDDERGAGNRRARAPRRAAIQPGSAPATEPDPDFGPQDGAPSDGEDDIDVGDYDMGNDLRHQAPFDYAGSLDGE